MAPCNAFKVLQFIVLLKNKEGDPIRFKMGETEENMFWIYWSLFCECDSFFSFLQENHFSEVVN